MTEPRTHYVYRAYNESGNCLYVGMTRNLAKRRQAHRSQARWWHWADRFVVRGPYDRVTATQVEKELIAYLLPLFNVADKPTECQPIRLRHLRDITQKHPWLPPYRVKEMPRDVFEEIASRRPEAISWDADVATIFGAEYRIADAAE